MPTSLFTSSKLDGRILAVIRECSEAVEERALPGLLYDRYALKFSPVDVSFALKQLEGDGRVTRHGGRKPSVVANAAKVVVVPALPGKEVDLMEALGIYLSAGFKPKVGWCEHDTYFAKDVSYSGPKKGMWERPDFMVVHGSWLPILGRRHVDVHSFELKTEDGCTMASVYEATHQRRATHYGYLVWNLPKGSARETELKSIQDTCLAQGIGLVRMSHSKEGHKFEHLHEPTRHGIQDRVVEGFLAERLNKAEKDDLAASLRSIPA